MDFFTFRRQPGISGVVDDFPDEIFLRFDAVVDQSKATLRFAHIPGRHADVDQPEYRTQRGSQVVGSVVHKLVEFGVGFQQGPVLNLRLLLRRLELNVFQQLLAGN